MLRGDRQGVGGNKLKYPFGFQKISVPLGTNFYFFTDGFIDQNDSKRRPFTRPRFEEAIKENQKDSFINQKFFLLDALAKHQKTELQRDDISVACVRL